MPRSGAGVYTAPPGSTATTITTITSASYNALIADLVTDANTPRPISAGGTGASSADSALTALGATTTGKALLTAASPTAAQAVIGSQIPPGAVMHFYQSAAPSGWLKANGQAVSRVTYAALFAEIGTTGGVGDGSTTFNVPDLRGEFIRAWDDSRGVDTGRANGSAQTGQNASHTHTGTADSGGAHTHIITGTHTHTSLNSFNPGSGVSTVYSGPPIANSLATSSDGAHTHTLTIAASGGTEARPRNIALLACIKY